MSKEQSKSYVKYLWFIIAVVILVLDLITKAVTDGVIHKEAIPGIFCIESYHNTGASFSIFAGSSFAKVIFIILGIVVSIGLILFTIFNKKEHFNAWYYIGATLMIGGIIGNLVDRIVFGYVRDFISLQFMNFAVFNIADSALTIGVICLAVWLVFFAFQENKGKENGKTQLQDK